MRLASTSLTLVPVVQMPLVCLVTSLVLHLAYHQPPLRLREQLSSGHASLSLSRVVNICPLTLKWGCSAAVIASPASPLYPVTASRYLSTSSLMENVEYSAEYHRPEVRRIYSHRHTVLTIISNSQTSVHILTTNKNLPLPKLPAFKLMWFTPEAYSRHTCWRVFLSVPLL